MPCNPQKVDTDLTKVITTGKKTLLPGSENFAFCGKTLAIHHIDVSVRSQQIIFAAGPIYNIEDVKGVKKVKTLSTFEIAKRYTVQIKGKETFLYEDCGKWFVEMRT